MTKEKRVELYKQSLELWGEEAQYDQCIEEMAELTIALNKLKRQRLYGEYKGKDMLSNFFEEIADVFMCLEEFQFMYPEYNLEKTLDTKLGKLKNLMEKLKKEK